MKTLALSDDRENTARIIRMFANSHDATAKAHAHLIISSMHVYLQVKYPCLAAHPLRFLLTFLSECL